MNFKAVRNIMQPAALFSSLACLVCGVVTTFFFTSNIPTTLFWLFLIISFTAALISFPRWKSLVALVLIALAFIWSAGGGAYGYRSTNPSPDGKYKLVIYSRPMLIAFPGQGSDAPGYVQLQDQSGRVLAGGYVEMVQNAYEVEWREDEVDVGPHGDGSYTWKLPK